MDKLSVVYLFQWQQMSVHSGLGWLSILANLATSVAGAMFLMWIVSAEGHASYLSSSPHIRCWCRRRPEPVSMHPSWPTTLPATSGPKTRPAGCHNAR